MTVTTDHPNVQVVHAMTDAIFSQDHDALARIFTDDLVFHFRGPHPMAGDHTGLGGFLAVLGWIFEKTNGQIELDTKLCLGTEGWAAEFERAQLGRNGETIESENAFVYRFEGDRIAEMWMYVGLMPDLAEAFFG
jgi:ketosteroid isomerase-like protein